MKAEELMIGDWVNLYDSPIKVNIDDLGVIERDEIYDKGVHCGPIPLTEEILEKNGFEKNEEGLYRISGNIVFNIHSYRLDMYNYDSEYLPYIKICDCKYVHKLQHLLKDLEIDKEIVLKDLEIDKEIVL